MSRPTKWLRGWSRTPHILFLWFSHEFYYGTFRNGIEKKEKTNAGVSSAKLRLRNFFSLVCCFDPTCLFFWSVRRFVLGSPKHRMLSSPLQVFNWLLLSVVLLLLPPPSQTFSVSHWREQQQRPAAFGLYSTTTKQHGETATTTGSPTTVLLERHCKSGYSRAVATAAADDDNSKDGWSLPDQAILAQGDTSHYNSLLKRLFTNQTKASSSSSSSSSSLPGAMRLLRWMEEQQLVNVLSYSTVISGLLASVTAAVASSCTIEQSDATKTNTTLSSVELATDLLESMQQWYDSNVRQKITCNQSSNMLTTSTISTAPAESLTVTYNVVLKAWKTMSRTTTTTTTTSSSSSSSSTTTPSSSSPSALECAVRAEELLHRMMDRQVADTISYTTVIGILANTRDKSAAQRANAWFDRMMQRYDETLDKRIQPNVQTLNSVLHAWVQCGNVKRAEQLLRQMESWSHEGKSYLAPNVVSYSTVMSGYVWCEASTGIEKSVRLRVPFPCVHLIQFAHFLIKRWSKSRDKDALQRAEQAFDRLAAMHHNENNNNKEDTRPNLFVYVNLINAYAKQSTSSAAGDSSDGSSAAEKAQEALFSMYTEYKEGKNPDLKPNTQLVTTVMECWQRSGSNEAGEQAESLLGWLLTRYEESGYQDDDLCPNEYTFASAIAAWAKSRRFGKAVRARKLLNRMVQLYEAGHVKAGPNTHCYTAVINACAYCENEAVDKRNALKIAIATYKELCASSYGTPNKVTYLALLTALRNLLPPGTERTAAVQTVFRNAARDGHVDYQVIRRVQSALTQDELQDLLSAKLVSKKGEVNLGKLPVEWTRNAATTAR